MGAFYEIRVGRATVRVKGAGLLLAGGAAIVVVLAVFLVLFVLPSLRTDVIPTSLAKPLDANRIRQQRAEAMAIPLPAASEVTGSLRDADFEGPYHPVPAAIPGQKARIFGNIAAGWLDLSYFTDATVSYAQDTDSPQAGHTSQRIEVQNLHLGAGDVMFAQPIRLTDGQTYHASVWLRASAPGVPVLVSLRMRGKPYRYYGSAQAKVGLKWQRVDITGKVTDHIYPYSYLMLDLTQPGATVWVDSAQVR